MKKFFTLIIAIAAATIGLKAQLNPVAGAFSAKKIAIKPTRSI